MPDEPTVERRLFQIEIAKQLKIPWRKNKFEKLTNYNHKSFGYLCKEDLPKKAPAAPIVLLFQTVLDVSM